MNVKKTALTIAMMIFMVFAISGVTEASYAYWASNVTAPANSDTTGTIGVGTWTFAAQYDPNTSYNVGDIVSNNGSTYQAKKSGLLKEPGVAPGWNADWNQIG
jgi:hypothetical protein